ARRSFKAPNSSTFTCMDLAYPVWSVFWRQRQLRLTWVPESLSLDTRKRRQSVGLALRLPCRRDKNILDRLSAHQQRIPNERAVTSPRHRLRTHNRDRRFPLQFNQLPQRFPESLCLHIVCVAAKAGVPPPRIDRTFLRFAQPAQRLHPSIYDADRLERSRQRLPAELRIKSRFRNLSHIHQQVDAVVLQGAKKKFDRKRGVADG